MSEIKIAKNKRSQSGLPDPLYAIFEQHLYNFQDSNIDRKAFIGQVIQDYLTHLRKLKIAIPKAYEPHVVEELAVLVNSMLIKKIYGCFSIDEYRKKKTPAPSKKTTLLRPSRARSSR